MNADYLDIFFHYHLRLSAVLSAFICVPKILYLLVQPIAGVLGACEGFAQPLAIAPLDRLDECAEIGMVLTQRIKQGVPVRETDVAPHYRIARRDARGVSEATRGIFQNGAMIVVPHHHV